VKTILLVAADRDEFAGLRRRLGRLVRLQWPIGYSASTEWRGKRLLLAANGPGLKLAGEAVDVAGRHASIGALVSTGFCGGLNPALGPGEIFVASRLTAAGEAETYPVQLPVASRSYCSGTLISVDHVVPTVREKSRLRAHGADAVDMEAVAVARRAARWGVPFFCVRVITDTAGESFVCDLNGARGQDGRFRRWKIVLSACHRPREGFPELVRLRRRTRRGALALGEFLAGCEFPLDGA